MWPCIDLVHLQQAADEEQTVHLKAVRYAEDILEEYAREHLDIGLEADTGHVKQAAVVSYHANLCLI